MTNLRTKGHLLSIIFKNNRLDDYRECLDLARRGGYSCCSVYDFYEQYILQNKPLDKVLILRHDIDYICPGTRRMYEIEKEYGVKATYYFRDSTVDLDLIKELHDDGFDVGYHYETIANMIVSGKIKQKSDIVINKVREEFLKELETFECRAGFTIHTCASHGAPENEQIGVSNNVIFEDVDAKSLNIDIEAYDIRIIDSLTRYICDGGIMVNYGFAYGGYNILESLSNNEPVICFLSHPNHWDMSLYQRFRKLVRMLLGKGVYHSNSVFNRIGKL